jgi:molybdenum cofactor cytidylyltransferase
MSAPALHILILAAGASRRMRGADKLLEQVLGEPLLSLVTRRALLTGLPVTVALPPDRPLRGAALDGLEVSRITVPDPSSGLSASLAAGSAHVPEGASLLVLLADLPEITTEDLNLMAAARAEWPDHILRATDTTGQPGHPVIFPPWARAELAGLSGDDGAREVLRTHAGRLRLIPLPAAHATTDLDTPEAWALWRSGRE